MLAAARTVFLRDGASASVRAVAEEAGISHAAILQRFGTKKPDVDRFELTTSLTGVQEEREEFIASIGTGPWGEDEPRLIEQFSNDATKVIRGLMDEGNNFVLVTAPDAPARAAHHAPATPATARADTREFPLRRRRGRSLPVARHTERVGAQDVDPAFQVLERLDRADHVESLPRA
mgnify:CR=1 FL=1